MMSGLPVTSEANHAQEGHPKTAKNCTHGPGLLMKQRTLVVDKSELDVMVVGYSCHDSSVLTALGKHSKEAKWKVQMGHDTDPLDITLHVDRGIVSGPAVHVTSKGKTIFETTGGYTRKAMYEDFENRWPFRGTIRGLNEPGMYELRPHAATAPDEWFPATITGQREDGHFQVVTMNPDFDGLNQASYPFVDKKDLRETGTHKPLQIPERCLTLQVPRDHPLHACLSLDGKDLVTHHFAWPSPTRSLASDNQSADKRLQLCVSKDRKTVTGNVGHAIVSHFVSGEVRQVSSDTQRLKHSWTIQVGPFTEHTIVVEKKCTLSKIISLTIDGQPFVEASAEDIDCHSGGWECKFRFVGQRTIDFEVHETNRSGVSLDSKDHVLQKRKYVHDCCIRVGDDMDLSKAGFTIDKHDFKELPICPQLHDENGISISPEALNFTYGILAPYKINHSAPCGMFALSNPQVQALSNTQGSAQNAVRRVRKICC